MNNCAIFPGMKAPIFFSLISLMSVAVDFGVTQVVAAGARNPEEGDLRRRGWLTGRYSEKLIGSARRHTPKSAVLVSASSRL